MKIAPPSVEFPFLKVKPVIFTDVELTVKILLNPSASKIASPSPYFMKFKFLTIVNPILSSIPLYSPDAIIIVS